MNEHPLDPEITLEIQNRLEDVALVGTCVNRLSEYHGFTAERCFEVELCVVEAVTNCVRHAYGDDTHGRIRVVARYLSDHKTLELVVHDWGEPIPAEWAPGSDKFRFEEEGGFEEGGRGMFLITELMDEVEYLVDQDSSNQLTMRKKIDDSPASAAG